MSTPTRADLDEQRNNAVDPAISSLFTIIQQQPNQVHRSDDGTQAAIFLTNDHAADSDVVDRAKNALSSDPKNIRTSYSMAGKGIALYLTNKDADYTPPPAKNWRTGKLTNG